MRIKIFTLVLLVSVLGTPDSYAQNLVTNGDFSLGAVGWQGTFPMGSGVFPVQVAAVADCGGAGPVSDTACLITYTSSVRQMVAVQPNTNYALTFHASRNTEFTAYAASPSSLLVTVTRNSTSFLNVTSSYAQSSDPFTFSNEIYYFTTAPGTDSVALDFKIPVLTNPYTHKVVLDDIEISASTPCTGAPAPGTASCPVSAACMTTEFSVSLSGFSTGSGISFQWESSPAGQNIWSNVGTNSSNILISGQSVSTDYRCRIACANSGLFAYSNTVTVVQNPLLSCYCVPVYLNGCTTAFMDSVYLPGEAGSAINSIGTGCSVNAYDDRSAVDSVVMGQSETYPVNITGPGYGITKVWIDFDDDGIFQGSEFVGSGAGPLPYGFNILIPAAANIGIHRMRMRFGGTSSTSSCSTEFLGETHDYSVRIIAAPTCQKPYALTALATQITATSASLGWYQPGTSSQWQIEYGPAGFIPGTGTKIVVGSNPYVLTGLTPATAYKYYVRTICAPGDTSGWSLSLNFTTQPSCFAPTLNYTTNVTVTTAELHWSLVAPSAQWEIEYKQGFGNFQIGTGTRILVNTNPYTITGLLGSTQYTYYMRSVCGPGDTSAWGYSHVFTTAVSCAKPWSMATSYYTTTDTSAVLEWTNPSGASLWQIEYGTGSNPTLGTGTRIMVSSNPFTLNGLTPGTVYWYQVRAVCGPVDTSAWAIFNGTNQRFHTRCAPAAPPYLENFDTYEYWDLPLCMRSNKLPGFWQWSMMSYPPSSNAAFSGNGHIVFIAGCNDTIHTAPLDLIAGTDYFFSCQYVTDGEPGWDDLSLIVSTTSDPSGYLGTIGSVLSATDTVYQPLTGNFTPWASGTYYFGVYCFSSQLTNFKLSVDDLEVSLFPLAIGLSGINAVADADRNRVSWTTATEAVGDVFILEHGTNGKDFIPLETVKAVGTPQTYTYLHERPAAGYNFYRLRLKDANGSISYSRVVKVNNTARVSGQIQVTPNPFSGRVAVKIPVWTPNSFLLIHDLLGRVVMRVPVERPETEIDLAHLPVGTYILSYPGSGYDNLKLFKH